MEAGCCGLTLLTGGQITLWCFILLTGNARELHPTGAVPHKRPLLFCGNAAAADLNDHPSHQTLSFYSNERLASRPLQTDRDLYYFTFHSSFSLSSRFSCVQPLHQSGFENPVAPACPDSRKRSRLFLFAKVWHTRPDNSKICV